MSQEWDIDDILASLDELLQEGKGAEAKGKENLSPIRAVAQSEAAVLQKSMETKPKVAKLEPLESKSSVSALVEPQSHHTIEKVKLQPPKRWDIDVPDANFRHEPTVDGEGDAPILPRVMLTQDMMVEPTDKEVEAFSPLLDAMDEDDVSEKLEEKEEVSQKPEKQNQGIHLNAHQLEQVLELVSMDVSYQFNQLLPNMIRQSLYKHLNMRQNEDLEQEQNKQKNEKP